MRTVWQASKRGRLAQAIGRSRGGPTTRVHTQTDEPARRRAVVLAPGNAHELSGARDLPAIAGAPRHLPSARAPRPGQLDRRGCAVKRSAPSTNRASLTVKRDDTGTTDQPVCAKPSTASLSENAVMQQPGDRRSQASKLSKMANYGCSTDFLDK